MSRADEYQKLMTDIAATSENFERRLEPSAVTDNDQSVTDYNQVLNTNITVNYALSLDLIHRSRGAVANKSALDLCSGPGHLSLCLNQFLGYERVTGLDFSGPMIEVAKKNAGDRANFFRGNVLKFPPMPNQNFDLVSFTNAGHHFESVGQITQILTNAESVCSKNGVIVMTDLARLPSPNLTDRFVALAGADFRDQKLDAMYEDFLASMYASFSPNELASAISPNTDRRWFQIVMKDLPFFQALIGLPSQTKQVFQRESFDWRSSGFHRSENAAADWSALSGLLYANPPRELIPNRRFRQAS